MVAIGLALICGALLVIGIMRADVFKTQPSQMAVSAAYADRAKVETKALQDERAAELAHTKAMQRASEEFWMTVKDLGVVAIGVLVLGVAAGVSAGSYRAITYAHTHARVIRPNARGQLPLIVDRASGLITNPNLMITATQSTNAPQSVPALGPADYLALVALDKQTQQVASQSMQKVYPLTAMAERKLAQGAMGEIRPAIEPRTDDVTGVFREVEDVPMGHIVEGGKIQALGGASPSAPLAAPLLEDDHELTEEEFYRTRRG